MPEEKRVDFVKWFSELNKDSGNIAGGKGANLAEIYNIKIPVPPGFVVTAQAYRYFIEKAGLKEKIEELLERIDYEDTKQLDEITRNIRTLITDSKLPKEMEDEIIDEYEALDAPNLDFEKGTAMDILKKGAEPVFVAVRSSATAEDLADASFAGQQDTYLNVKGNQELLKHVKKCFASLYTSRATYYRNKKGFKHADVSLAVVVQKMVDADKSGVIFSKDPSYKKEDTIIEAVWGLGEGIVSGKITPDTYIVSKDLELLNKKIADKKIAITRDSSGGKAIIKLREEKSKHQVLTEYEIKKLTDFALKLEEHYQKPQDIEFAIEGEEIYIVQTRPITTISSRVAETQDKKIEGEVILTGLAASPGIASGKIKIVEKMEDLENVKKGDVLVTEMTNPDMVVSMQRSAAIVTDEGGLTSHAAIVSREMGIPAVVGTQEATAKLKDGEVITVDGFTGKIYKGKTSETVQKEVLPVTANTKTKIKVIVDLPSFAKRASQTGIKQVGLTRIEGIIAESGKHPEYFLKQNKIEDYEEVIYQGIKGIAKYFDEMWIRTSDIRSDEYSNLEGAPKEIEANPMLGFHGIRYSIKKPKIFQAELKALKRVADEGKTIGLLLPQIISVEEIQETKKNLREIGFSKAKVGVMVETPAAVQTIRQLCEEGIDFISFGTNDLTQYILAVDRGNEEVQHLYNEMHPAVLQQIAYVIRTCKKFEVETSICGQAGSRKEMVKYLVENRIDSISVNADMAKEISDYVAELESARGEQPRQYNPENKNQNLKKQEDNITAQQNQEKEDQQNFNDDKQKNQANSTPSPEIQSLPNKINSEPQSKVVPENNQPEFITDPDEEIKYTEQEKQEYLEEHPKEIAKDNFEEGPEFSDLEEAKKDPFNEQKNEGKKQDLDIY